MTIVALSSPAPPLPLRSRWTPTPPSASASEEEQPAPVGDDESDPEPGGLVDLVREVVPVLEPVEPFAGEPHAGSGRGGRRAGARSSRAEATGSRPRASASEVALASRAPKTTVAPTRWSRSAKLCSSGRMAASSSGTGLPDHVDDDQHDRRRGQGAEQEPGRGPVQRRELGARAGLAGGDERSAFSAGFAYSTKERSSATVAIAQRTIAAITQPSQTWKASCRIASQIPNPIAPTRPTTVVAVPTIATRLRLSVASGGVDRAERDDDDPGHHERAHERRRASAGGARRSSPRSSSRFLECRSDPVGRHRQAAEADADGVEDGVADRGGDRVAGRLAGTRGPLVRPVDRDHVDRRSLREADDSVVVPVEARHVGAVERDLLVAAPG